MEMSVLVTWSILSRELPYPFGRVHFVFSHWFQCLDKNHPLWTIFHPLQKIVLFSVLFSLRKLDICKLISKEIFNWKKVSITGEIFLCPTLRYLTKNRIIRIPKKIRKIHITIWKSTADEYKSSPLQFFLSQFCTLV